MSDLVFPPWLLEEWRHDARWLATGRAVRVLLIGSPGVGKTAAARRVGRDAFRLAQSLPNGRKARGICVLDPSVGMTGCSYVPQTENILLLAMRRARQLTESGYICVLILDEADAILGEWPDRGTEHAHNRSRRLAAQYTLSEDIEGMAIYLTMNTRRGLRLSAAITRRFLARNYPRPTRGQIAAVARYYIGRHSDILGQVGMSAEEFGQELADNLFSDRRVVAIAHLRSGRDLAVRARDLQTCSPGQVERSIAMWCLDMTHGVSRSMDDLWSLLDRDFSAPALSARNLHDLTFIEPSAGDGLIALEFMARSRGARRYPGESGNDPRNGG